MIRFVRFGYSGKTVCYPVSRQGKHVTLIVCIAADGSFLRPAMIIRQNTYGDNLGTYGFTKEKLEAYSQGRGFAAEVMNRRNRYLCSGPAMAFSHLRRLSYGIMPWAVH
jgi:hypothetical protein